MNIDLVFADIQKEIAGETVNKNLLNELEQEFIAAIAPTKNEYARAGLMVPLDLGSAFFSETDLVGSTGQQLVNNTERWAYLYREYVQRLEEIDCKKIQKDRIYRKINEEIIFLLLTNRYYLVIAQKFLNGAYPKSIRMTSVNDELGAIMTPAEVMGVLGTTTLEYTDYLLSLLKLTDIVVGFTTNSVIKISMNLRTKTDYGVSYVNSLLIANLETGFKQLDLKNDNVRRKYDALKYNLKKINDILYDLSLRNMLPQQGVELI